MKFVINLLLGLLVTLALSSVSLAESSQEAIDSGKDDFKRGQFEQAVQAWEQARQHISKNEPKYVDISVSLAAAYQKLGRLTKAFEVLESALDHVGNISDPKERAVSHAKVLMHLSDVYVALRDYEKDRMDCGMKEISQKLDPFTREQLITKAENSLEKAEQEMAVIDPNQKDYPLVWANIFNRQGNLQWLTEKTGLLSEENKNNKEETDKEEETYPDYINSSMNSIKSASLFVPVQAMDRELVSGRKEAKALGYCGKVEQVLADKLIELNNNTAVDKNTTEAQVLIVKTLINCLSQIVLLEDINNINIEDFSNELEELYILSRVKELPDSHDKAFAFISLAQLMLTISSKIDDDKKRDLHSRYVYHALTEAVILAGKLRNLRTMAYAKFYLAQFYEKTPFYQETQRYQKAISLTRQALFSVHKYLQFPTELQRELWGNPELLYRLNWQLARLLKAQQSIEVRQETTPTASLTTIENAYKTAEKNLLQVRRHYGSFSKTLGKELEQFYKDWAEFLIKQAAEESLKEEKQELLKQARDKIEEFQAQVVRNYFEDECITEWGEYITDIDGFLSSHPNTAIFYPVLFDDRIELLLSSSKGIIHRSQKVDKSKLKFAVKELQQQREELENILNDRFRSQQDIDNALKNTNQNIFLPILKNVYQVLIKPIVGELKQQQIKNLIIVPGEGTIEEESILYKIPFAAIPFVDESDDGQEEAQSDDEPKYLIDKYALSVIPGITLTVSPKPIYRQKVRALLAGADFKEGQSGSSPNQTVRSSDTENKYPQLPCVPLELEEITCILEKDFTNGDRISERAEFLLKKSKKCSEFELDRKLCDSKGKVVTLKNENFTYSRLKQELQLRHYSIVHLATHGKIGTSQEEATYLVVGSDYDHEKEERITLPELKELIPGGLDLLVLSACEVAGNATLGMAGTALKTGAGNTLGARWQVRDTAATYVMIEFYQHWMNHPDSSMAEALQHAQKKLKDQGGRYKHPIYWASFLLTGNGW